MRSLSRVRVRHKLNIGHWSAGLEVHPVEDIGQTLVNPMNFGVFFLRRFGLGQ